MQLFGDQNITATHTEALWEPSKKTLRLRPSQVIIKNTGSLPWNGTYTYAHTKASTRLKSCTRTIFVTGGVKVLSFANRSIVHCLYKQCTYMYGCQCNNIGTLEIYGPSFRVRSLWMETSGSMGRSGSTIVNVALSRKPHEASCGGTRTATDTCALTNVRPNWTDEGEL